MTTLGYNGAVSAALWNPPPPPIQQVHQRLIGTLQEALVALPIQQQTVIIAVRHEEEDAWTVDILNAPPLRGRYDGWTDCQIDFDQYHGSIACIRQRTAAALAADLMEQRFPGWRNSREFGPAWDADPPDLN